MGVLNVTPDSFSDGGRYDQAERAVEHALYMVEAGAEVIDVGGESTRPGAEVVGVEEEIRRTVPLVEAIREASDVLVSIDTSKAAVAEAAIEAGADIVNDVTGLRGDSRMVGVCAGSGVGVCVMHMQGEPRTMQRNPVYENEGGVVAAVGAFFTERLEELCEQGVDPECVCFDPGIGFGKTLEHNMELLRHLGDLQDGRPVLLGVSRKSFIGALTGVADPADRDAATAVVTALAYRQGVMLHRVHNVAVAVEAIRMASALCP